GAVLRHPRRDHRRARRAPRRRSGTLPDLRLLLAKADPDRGRLRRRPTQGPPGRVARLLRRHTPRRPRQQPLRGRGARGTARGHARLPRERRAAKGVGEGAARPGRRSRRRRLRPPRLHSPLARRARSTPVGRVCRSRCAPRRHHQCPDSLPGRRVAAEGREQQPPPRLGKV
ncbi:MAG: hypothetical protein AVDCRST_MAG58-2621, partial [uncultured Rubrobacteraceae bacterium]